MVTCETSAGSPSGHVMFQAALFYVIFTELFIIAGRKFPPQHQNKIKLVGWTIYGMILTLVGSSRMYFGCHFFHQCIFGAILGYLQTRCLIGRGGVLNQVVSARKWPAFKIWFSMILMALIVYFWQLLLGVDPMWTIRIVSIYLTKKNC